jgi:hypothetical protein
MSLNALTVLSVLAGSQMMCAEGEESEQEPKDAIGIRGLGRRLAFLLPTSLFRRNVIQEKRRLTMLGTILIVILLLALIGAVPAWPYSTGWGYYPSGGLGLVLLVVVVLLLLGRI